MEALYAPYLGKTVTQTDVPRILDSVNDDTQWEELKPLDLLQGDVLANRVVRSYVVNILTYDYGQAPFQYVASEKKLYAYLH